MPHWQSDYIETNGLKLHYTRTGGNKPPFILTHGFSDDGLCWTPVAEVLATDYDVIMLDARGHGLSDGPEEGYGSLDYAADVAGVIDGLGLHKPLVLGHSMGAATALALAGTYPDLPGAILLEDPPPWWSAQAPVLTSAERRRRFGGRIVELKRKTAQELIDAQRIQSPKWSEAELGPWAMSKVRLSFNVITTEQSTPVDWPNVVAQITCPALLITADPELGGIVTPEAAADFQRILPQAQVEHIGDAGHSIRREQFARYMDVVQAFLSGLK